MSSNKKKFSPHIFFPTMPGAAEQAEGSNPLLRNWHRSPPERLREAMDTGAEILSSACPFCYRNLSDAKDENKMNIRIMDVMELVQISMKT